MYKPGKREKVVKTRNLPEKPGELTGLPIISTSPSIKMGLRLEGQGGYSSLA